MVRLRNDEGELLRRKPARFPGNFPVKQRHRELLRLFPWPILARMKIAARLHAWANTKATRRGVAVRDFTWCVSPSTVSATKGLLTFPFPIRGESRKFALRTQSSDIEVFLQIIRDEEYGEAVRHMPLLDHAPRIVDAGANIGLTSLYLKTLFPDAVILALEPEPGNFEALKRTISINDLRSVVAIPKGLWTADVHLQPNRNFRDGEAWSFSLMAGSGSNSGDIPAVSLRTLLETHGWETIDLLKIDIEGGEAPLLRDPETVRLIANCVSLLCMEVHPEVMPVDEARRTLEDAGMTTFLGPETLVAWPRTGSR